MTLKVDQISDKGRKQIRLSGEFPYDHVDQVKVRSTNGGWQGTLPHGPSPSPRENCG
jgi:hypothetical protein